MLPCIASRSPTLKCLKPGELLPHFPELLPLIGKKGGNGARIIEIWEVLQNEGFLRRRDW